jgi:serine/threonine protein kinase
MPRPTAKTAANDVLMPVRVAESRSGRVPLVYAPRGMSAPRVGHRELGAPSAPPSADDVRLLTQVGAVLGSPLGVLVVVPGMVLFIGLLLTVIGQAALRKSALAQGLDEVSTRTELVARQVGLALAQSDVVLDRLASLAEAHSPALPFDGAAFAMRDMMQGRAGIGYVSISFPDGTFQGAYPEEGTIRLQDSRLAPGGTRVRRFETDGRKELLLRSEEQTGYDPRTREFYRLALASPGAVWTKPYPFYKTNYTGITRTRAVRAPDGTVRAVLTVDFDVNELSRYLERIPLAGARVLLYASDGTLLADPAASARIRALPVRSDRPLHFRDLGDPVLDAFFAASAHRRGSFALSGERYLVSRATVGDPALGWSAASFVPEALLLAPAREYQRRAGLFALVSVLVAVLVAVVFSRHLVRMRRQTAEARALATRAAAQARELGSYRLTTRLGAGGMGEVWRAEHRLLAREAAIKLIRAESAPSPEARERFRREAQTLAALRSRHTIELFDYGVTDDGTFFYVMELLDGLDLDSFVDRHGPLPPARVRALLMQATSSLAEAHAAGLVHRDIKPANLYLCRAADEVDLLKVLDFGLVRSLADATPEPGPSLEELSKALDADSLPSKLTAAGAVVGTPDFMAPEQILGLETDGRTDIYALGCVAYFLLSGQLPFPTRGDAMATMVAHLQVEPVDLVARAKHPLPPGMSALVMRCLSKKALERPQSAIALRRELAELRCVDPWTEELAADWWARHMPRRPSQTSLAPVAPAAVRSRA